MNARELLNFWRLREADSESLVLVRYYVNRKGTVVITSIRANS